MGRNLTPVPALPNALPRRVVAVLTFAVGLVTVASVLRPGLVRRVEFLADILPSTVVSASAAVSVAVGVLLLGLAVGLGRGKRRAWRVAVVLLAADVVLQASQAHHAVALAAAALLVGLLLTHRHFIGRSEPVGRSRALVIGSALLVTSVALGWTAVALLADREGLGLTAGQSLRDSLVGFVGVSSPVTEPDGRESDSVYYLLVALAATTVLVTGALVLRAPRASGPVTADDVARLRHLVDRFGGDDSLAYFALRHDRTVVWGPGQRAAVSYRRIGSTMLAAGDPLGPRAEWPGAIEAFVRTAQQRSVVPAAVACTEQGAQAWARYGKLTALELGDEAVLEVAGYSLQGRSMRNVRQAVTRAQRAGLSVRCARLSELPPETVSHLADLADTWRGAAIERGFSMALGRVDPHEDPGSVAVIAEREDEVHGLLVLVPWGTDGLSLDLMRRAGHAESGVNELMISGLMAAAPALGVRRVSLNFAVFREAIERSERFGAGPLTRLWGRVLRLASTGTQVDSLYRFNAKFGPRWTRRYLVYPPAVGLPRVTWAYLRAESFVPSLRRRATRPPVYDPGPVVEPPAPPADLRGEAATSLELEEVHRSDGNAPVRPR